VILTQSSLQDHLLAPQQILSTHKLQVIHVDRYHICDIEFLLQTFFLRSSSAISSLLRLVGWLSSSTIGAM